MYFHARRFYIFLVVASLCSVVTVLYAFAPQATETIPNVHPYPRPAALTETLSQPPLATPTSTPKETDQIVRKFAYATFLGPPTFRPNATATGNATVEEVPLDPLLDPYFVSARLLNYQIKHAGKTKTQMKGVPFLILVLPSVPASQIALLHAEGAEIVTVEPLDLPKAFDTESITKSRFRDVLAKLRLWELVAYEKILYLDADSFLLENLDALFTDPELGSVQTTRKKYNGTREAAEKGLELPKEYIMDASADTYGDQTDWEKPGHVNYLCACFMLIAPSTVLFNYYTSVLALPNLPSQLQNAAYPEQDLLIWAHRADGPMPWRRIPISWSANDGKIVDESNASGGVKSIHIKGWEGAEGGNVADEKWAGIWREKVREMEYSWKVLRLDS